MNHIFEITWSVWFLSEILLNRLFRSNMKSSKNQDRNSLRLIWITIIVSISLGIISKFLVEFPMAKSAWLSYSGLLIIVIGMVIRFIAILTLRRFFTVDLSIQHNHELINKGLYKYIRHPSYTGSLISFLGFSISMNNWISAIIIFVPVLLVFLHRMKLEEQLLLEKFGDKYLEYTKNTARLIPGVY